MDASTIIEELKFQLKNAKLEIKHLNAVIEELHDELTAAKPEVIQLKEAAEDLYYREVRESSEGLE